MPNRLIYQTSPYLLQHAHNPVDWYPWGEEALQRAKEENKPILVSIGYSACHWCHVMERESFENEATAELMNQHFINIKIDREERPDLDHVYMDAVQTMSGSGGWPLNVFLTPEAKPFFGGTYFPPVKAYNRSSWQDVLTAINIAWHEKPNEIIAQAENLTDHLQNATLFGGIGSTEKQFSEEQLISISQNLMKTADTTWGGFGNAPKFPQTFSIQFLLRQYYHLQKKGSKKPEFDESTLLNQALLSLDKMINGGIYDHLGGGFARYSTDAHWLAPHFEKMLYDNALLISVMSEAYQLTGKNIYKSTIEQTMDFIAAEWRDTDGGFFSAYDADSEGEEGKFYTWEKNEVQALIPEPRYFQLFSDYYDISEEGNWEGTNILWVQQPLEIFCKANGYDDFVEAEKILAECRTRLLQERNKRIKPLLDDKKLMGWNALMITACCKAWAALANNKYLQMAEKAAGFIETCLLSRENYHHNYKAGKAANPAFLDDLACYIQSLCHLQECTGKTGYLDKARSITSIVLEQFSDEKTPFFFYTPKDQADIIIRKKEIYDSAVPSGNSMMTANLMYLGTLLDNPTWRKRAEAMTVQMAKLVLKYPASFGLWAQILQWHAYGLHEVAVVGENSVELSAGVLHFFIPNKVMQQSSAENNKYPLLAGKKQQGGNALIYVCKEFSCKKPVVKTEDFLSLIDW